jgi:hypothetical protein
MTIRKSTVRWWMEFPPDQTRREKLRSDESRDLLRHLHPLQKLSGHEHRPRAQLPHRVLCQLKRLQVEWIPDYSKHQGLYFQCKKTASSSKIYNFTQFFNVKKQQLFSPNFQEEGKNSFLNSLHTSRLLRTKTEIFNSYAITVLFYQFISLEKGQPGK